MLDIKRKILLREIGSIDEGFGDLGGAEGVDGGCEGRGWYVLKRHCVR